MPQLWVAAGPNGAGKSTLVSQRLARRIPIVNPDVIAQELPRVGGRLDERRAGEMAVGQRNALLVRRADFGIETTLSGNSATRFMRTAKAAGYKVTLVYVGLSTAAASARRVMDRVQEGGHSVPVEAIQRRYPDSLARFAPALELADRGYLFDNSERRRLLLIRARGRVRFRAGGPAGLGARSLARPFRLSGGSPARRAA